MSELSKHYEAATIENKWYAAWEENKVFESHPDEREPYSIVIPPPNVTGILHMGHMLNNSIQDILIRKARLDGKNACWVPGTDHASIATEAKVVGWLREKGIKKGDISREKFLEYAWEWTDKYGGIILQQLKKLGASCDWSRTAFTMDEVRSRQVTQAFTDLYHKGKLYRGLRMVNWDPEAKTVLSNEEVIYGEEESKLYHVRYPVVDSKEYLVIATTRPETILADTGVAIHPDDPRYQHLLGRRIRIPIVDREAPVISDGYVEMEFGTGALKVTPAHDVNDYDIGQRHGLEVIDIFTDEAIINNLGGHYEGQDRFEARKNIVQELDEKGFLVKVEDYTNNVGRSERTGAVVEPKLSLQWYVSMESLAEPALKAVMEDEIKNPKNQDEYEAEENAITTILEMQLILWQKGMCVVGFDNYGIPQKVKTFFFPQDWDLKFMEYIFVNDPMFAGEEAFSKVWLTDERIILVPEQLYVKDYADEWFRKFHFLESEEILFHDNMSPALEAQIIFPIPENLKELLYQYLKEDISMNALSKVALGTSINDNGNFIKIVNLPKVVLLSLQENGKNILHQVCNYENSENIIYKIAIILQEKDLNQDEVQIAISGIAPFYNNILDELQSFFPIRKPLEKLFNNTTFATLDFLKKLYLCA